MKHSQLFDLHILLPSTWSHPLSTNVTNLHSDVPIPSQKDWGQCTYLWNPVQRQALMAHWHLLCLQHWQLPHETHTADLSWDWSSPASCLQNEKERVGSDVCHQESRRNAVTDSPALPYPSACGYSWNVFIVFPFKSNSPWELLSLKKG